VSAWVIPTNEELMIARHTQRVWKASERNMDSDPSSLVSALIEAGNVVSAIALIVLDNGGGS